jgi:Glycosyl-hydrolase 97 C-terminal, oligomerisation
VPLRFLSTGSYSAEIASDDDLAKQGLSISKQTVGPRDTIKLKLSAGGGGMVRIVPE